jgi:hypothetical protein
MCYSIEVLFKECAQKELILRAKIALDRRIVMTTRIVPALFAMLFTGCLAEAQLPPAVGVVPQTPLAPGYYTLEGRPPQFKPLFDRFGNRVTRCEDWQRQVEFFPGIKGCRNVPEPEPAQMEPTPSCEDYVYSHDPARPGEALCVKECPRGTVPVNKGDYLKCE